MINLNHDYLYLKRIPYGKTQNIVIKIGRNLYYVDINKNNDCAFIDFYRKRGTERNKQSKYNTSGSGTLGVIVKPDATLNREFFENIGKIKAAQDAYGRFSDILK